MTEFERAKEWRERMGLTVDQLAEITGYARETIYLMERGVASHRRPINPYVWQRYKVACAGAEYQIKSKQAFNW